MEALGRERRSAMSDRMDTTKLRPLPEGRETAADILAHVYRGLQAKG